MGYYVYILYSPSTDSFYKGQTSDLTDRLKRHNNKQEQPTKNGAPWKLVWFAEKESRGQALILEKNLRTFQETEQSISLRNIRTGSRALTFPDVHGQESQDADRIVSIRVSFPAQIEGSTQLPFFVMRYFVYILKRTVYK